MFKYWLDSVGRLFLVFISIGSIALIYSYHNPGGLRGDLTLNVIWFFLLIWILIPLYDYFNMKKQNKSRETKNENKK